MVKSYEQITPKSILETTKRSLGIEKEDIHFDQEIIININTVFFSLMQIGVGPKEGFFITDDTDEWTDFLDDSIDLEGVKTYIYLKTRLTFDPPQMGYLIESINKQIQELEWRLNVQVEKDLVLEGGIKNDSIE